MTGAPMMTVVEAVKIMRENGMHTSVDTVIRGIQAGFYTFGFVVSEGRPDSKHKRRCVKIDRRKFLAWLSGV